MMCYHEGSEYLVAGVSGVDAALQVIHKKTLLGELFKLTG